jgi:hypothetical protein
MGVKRYWEGGFTPYNIRAIGLYELLKAGTVVMRPFMNLDVGAHDLRAYGPTLHLAEPTACSFILQVPSEATYRHRD